MHHPLEAALARVLPGDVVRGQVEEVGPRLRADGVD